MRANLLARDVARELSCVSACAAFEARCMLKEYCGVTLEDIYLQKEIGDISLEPLKAAVKKRLEHIPLQYILGKWEFMGNDFYVDENVLIPRPETELLCECLADKMGEDSIVYDLCAGSGCIAVSIAKMTDAHVYAFEKYTNTFALLKKNIAYHNAEQVIPILCDITEAPPKDLPQADFILSNPPYIESALIPDLQSEVLAEPKAALDGGENGLLFYEAIAHNYVPLLKPGGWLALEMGEGQEAALLEIFNSLQHIQTLKDYSGIDRVMVFRKEYP
ncbi:MAG: peptide chain release factor N(5)-glutamine methyltransferase [Clostridia bacterium]|nr:peptide chain release factor N(5)-glutamine methyltransferase [Clostridia bacterium]